jgi:hypothetical protein
VAPHFPKKNRLGPQNDFGSSRPEKLLKIVNCQKLFWASWKRWVATDIHLDQSFLLRKKWSPLRWVPPSDEEIFVEFGPGWATCLGAGVALLWRLDKDGSFAIECPWYVCPQSDHCMHFVCNWVWALLVSFVLLLLRCPIVVENKGEGDPRWTMGAGQGKEECWAQKNYPLKPWW